MQKEYGGEKLLAKVIIIGGGVGGLSAAIELASKGVEIDLIDPNSLFTYLRANIGQSLLKNITADSTIPFIKLSDLKELQVVIPDDDKKQEIGKILNWEDDISKEIRDLQKKQFDLTKNIWNI